MRHADARVIVKQALAELGFPNVSPQALQAIQAVASFEASYGEPGKPPEWKGSKNWGAVHSAKPMPPCNEDTEFLWRDYDTHTKKLVPMCFKKYATDVAGAKDYIKHMIGPAKVRAATDTGDADQIALAMYDAHYFVGFKESPTGNPAERRALNAAEYAKGIARNAKQIAAALPEPLLVERRGVALPPEVTLPLPLPLPPLPPVKPAGGGGRSDAAAGGVVLVLAAFAGLAFYAMKGGR